MLEILKIKVARAWCETTPVCSGLTRLVRAGYSRHDSGASRERARITRRAQDGSIRMQRSLPSSSYPARSTLREKERGKNKGVNHSTKYIKPECQWYTNIIKFMKLQMPK